MLEISVAAGSLKHNFELGAREALLADFPQHAALLRELTR